MPNLPNALTLLRFALVPLIALCLLRGDYATASVLFFASALSDVADGMIARHWNLRTRFGAIADPLADKATMLTVAVLLAYQQTLPWWLAAAVASRDALIVGGALAYHFMVQRFDMAPSVVSKLNTASEFALLVAAMAARAGWVADGPWREVLLGFTLLTIFVSGAHYVFVWGRKAAQLRRR